MVAGLALHWTAATSRHATDHTVRSRPVTDISSLRRLMAITLGHVMRGIKGHDARARRLPAYGAPLASHRGRLVAHRSRLTASLLVLVLAACGREPAPARRDTPSPVFAWRAVGTWSGKGDRQTESIPSDSGRFRVRWATHNERVPGAGVFRLSSHSAVSGRALQLGVDERGVGSGVADFVDDPRVFYFVVESRELEWTFTVEEGVRLSAPGSGPSSP